MDTDWIGDLKVGDKFVTEGGWGDEIKLHRVQRITKTQIISGGNCKFRKENGRKIGSSGFRSTYMQQFTAIKSEQILRQCVKKLMEDADVSTMDIGKVHKLNEILKV